MDAELQGQIDVCDEDFFEDLGLGHRNKRSNIYLRFAKSWLNTH